MWVAKLPTFDESSKNVTNFLNGQTHKDRKKEISLKNYGFFKER